MFFFSLGIDNSPQERRCHAAHYVSKAKKEFLMSSPKSIGKKYHQIFDKGSHSKTIILITKILISPDSYIN